MFAGRGPCPRADAVALNRIASVAPLVYRPAVGGDDKAGVCGHAGGAMAVAKTRECWVGFDLGGTKMLAAVFDGNFRPIGRKRRKTRGQEGMKAGLDRLIGTIEDALADAGIQPNEVAGIGVGCPGPLDLDRGVVLETPNLGWTNAPVRRTLEKAFGCATVIANDVDAGVFGEYRFGAARGARCVVGVFPGTGIGGGCVYEGTLLRGRTGSCMEIGHIPVVPDGALCGCGRYGCLETVASRLAIAAAAAAAAHRGEAPHLAEIAGTDVANIRSAAISQAIEAGDQVVEQIVRKAARHIGWTMAGVVNLLAPDVVLLGGGLVEEMPELFRDEIKGQLKAQVMPALRKTFKMAVAELGDNASVTGAAAWAEHMIAGPAAEI